MDIYMHHQPMCDIYKMLVDFCLDSVMSNQRCSFFFFTPNTIYLRSNVIRYLSLLLVFGVEPDLTREGGSIPVTLTFQEATGQNVMLLPVGSSDDGAHSQNEKLNR